MTVTFHYDHDFKHKVEVSRKNFNLVFEEEKKAREFYGFGLVEVTLSNFGEDDA